MQTYADDLEEAARRHHLSWCSHPACVHVPFDEDRELARRILSLAEPTYTQRDLLAAACHHLLALLGTLHHDLGRLIDVRSDLDKIHRSIGEVL